MNIMIEIENPNEIQCNLIHLLRIQDKIKANEQDQEEIEKIQNAIKSITKKIQEE